ncbi:glycosyltransferase [Aliiroseovarius sp. YM-037]|uniref:glycosyltransferase n=1 Tax=Aliiroseovarius sp. YM-037 TaxID=3341728 RepID=UPI003A7FFB5F
MRVAYLTNYYPKISHTFIRREILALEGQGVEVMRFSLRGWDAELVDPIDQSELEKTQYTLKDGVAPLLLNMLRCMVKRPGPFWKAVKTALAMSRNGVRPWPYHLIYVGHACRICRWMEGKGVTHLHAHFGTNPAEIALLIHILGGPKYSFTIHGMDEADNGGRLAFDRKVGGAAFVATISSYTRSQLMRHVPPDVWPRLKVIRCGLPAGAFEEATTEPSKSPVFLCIARLSAEKGHMLLLESFADVLKNNPDAKLVFAGDGDLRPLIEARIEALGIAHAVRITGWISSDQVRAEIQGSHVLVQPSFIEGLPVVMMEAMAQERAVISTYVAGIPELVQPGKTGWLVPAGDSDELANAMEASITTPHATLIKMGRAGRKLAQERHNIETEVARLSTNFAETC